MIRTGREVFPCSGTCDVNRWQEDPRARIWKEIPEIFIIIMFIQSIFTVKVTQFPDFRRVKVVKETWRQLVSLFGLVKLRPTSSVEPTHERETHSSAGVTDQTARVCVCVCACTVSGCTHVRTRWRCRSWPVSTATGCIRGNTGHKTVRRCCADSHTVTCKQQQQQQQE